MLGGSGATRTITLTPLEAATGAANVTLTVTDPQGAGHARVSRGGERARGIGARHGANYLRQGRNG